LKIKFTSLFISKQSSRYVLSMTSCFFCVLVVEFSLLFPCEWVLVVFVFFQIQFACFLVGHKRKRQRKLHVERIKCNKKINFDACIWYIPSFLINFNYFNPGLEIIPCFSLSGSRACRSIYENDVKSSFNLLPLENSCAEWEGCEVESFKLHDSCSHVIRTVWAPMYYHMY
jgi:hypothetical protein